MKFTACVVMMASLALFAPMSAQDAAREKKLQQAIDLLETKGDVARAIPLLEDVGQSADQALAARGLLYLGQAQERQGIDAARKTYERVIELYSRQSDVVAEARARLATLGNRTLAVANRSVTSRVVATLDDATRVIGEVSPDGRYLPVTRDDGSGDAFLLDLATGTRRLVVRGDVESAAYVRSVVLSKDGKHLAYAMCRRKGGCDLRVMLTNGTARGSRSLFKEQPFWMGLYDWSPDRSFILSAVQSQEREPVNLQLVSTRTGATRLLSSSPQHPLRAAFSPDGKFVAADRVVQGSSGRDVVLFDLQRSRERPITQHSTNDVFAAWTPDGSRVVFTSDRLGSNSLWAQRLQAGTPQGEPVRLQRVVERFTALGITATGAMFSSESLQNVQTKIRTVPIDLTSGRYEEGRAAVVRECYGGSPHSPDYASDGRHLAFVCVRRIGGRRDYSIVIQSVGAAGRELRPRLNLISEVRWIPTAAALLVSGSDAGGISGFWRVDVATGDALLLARTTGPLGAIQSFASDGSRAYIHRRADVGDERVLLEIDLTTGGLSELFRGISSAHDERTPAVSGDGRKLFYRRSAGDSLPYGNAAFVERDLVSGVERVIVEGRPLRRIHLSPDGRLIMTTSDDAATKTRAMILIRVSDGNVRELMRMPIPVASQSVGASGSAPFGVLAWAPDSLSVIVHRHEAGTPLELWWVEAAGRTPPKRMAVDWKGQSVRLRPDGGEMVFLNMIQGATEIRVLEGAIK